MWLIGLGWLVWSSVVSAEAAQLNAAPLSTDAEQARLRQRGEYLSHVAGCHACHTDHRQSSRLHGGPVPSVPDPQTAELAGGAPIQTPFGIFYPPNITPDPDTGIGGWSDAEFAKALQHGMAPDGHRYYPVFPYTSYARLRADDVLALKRYLDQVTPVSRVNTAHELKGFACLPALLGVWQWLNVKPAWTALPATASATERDGAYLVEAVAHCGECHSPRDGIGGLQLAHWLRGARLASGHQASNLTPHPDGIAAWSADELAEYLQTGHTDMGAKAHHEMREFVDYAGRYLTEPDRAAIAAYLLALPARPERKPCPQTGPRLRRCLQ
ncbi:cytochrome C [Permianibacter sp. IMCC34836]|uniref:cytochrome C n=1 Tax=Permianibacter fluminis TaxID=2738515 RepID=UPI0015561780|nr:cytochrome C [Permianibacter fluminis]NQD38503.1 cytochrome C [Permianibacter fluminis]